MKKTVTNKLALAVTGVLVCAGSASAGWDTSGVTIPPNDTAAAEAITELANSGPDSDLKDALNSWLTLTQTQTAIDTMSPGNVISGTSSGVVVASSSSSSTALDRVAALRSDKIYASLEDGPEGPAGPTGSDRVLDKPGLWGKLVGTTGDQDDIDGVSGYEYDVYGLMFGIDKEIDNNLLLGVNLGYLQTDVDSGVNTNTDIDNFVFGIYTSIHPGNWFLDLGMNYTNASLDSDRQVIVGSYTENIQGDTDGDTYSFFANYGYDFVYGTHVITPILGLQYSSSKVDGYTETGGDSALQLDDNRQNLLNSTLGVKYEYVSCETMRWKGRLMWTHEFEDTQSIVNTRYTGSGNNAAYFESKGIDVDEDRFSAGFGLKYYPSENISLDFDYDYEIADEFDSHSGSILFKYYY